MRQRQLLGVGLAVVCLLAAGTVEAAPVGAGPVGAGPSTADQVQYQQKTVEAQMQELQDRMYHLAELTRQSEPDDSARLLMALRKAREDLIIEQIRDVLDQLSHSDLAKAAEGQQQVLVKLEELKKLLTSTDFDLQMQLERLRKLNDAIRKLDAGIKEEKRQRDQSGDLSQRKILDAKLLAGPQQEQQRNRQGTEAVAEALKDLGPAPAKAGQTLGNAALNMSLAEGRLGAGKPSDAQGLQGQAVDSMESARKQLEEERQKILEELQGQVRKQVIENLTEMLDRQKSVRGATEAVVGHLPSGERQTILRVKQLAPPENAIVRICDQTTDLIEETEFSVALPPALKEIHERCTEVADQLQSGIADAPLVSSQKRIEQDLADLIDTFKELAGDPGDSKCKGCKGNKNKLLAELKVLRLLQARVNQRTQSVDAQRGGDAAGPPTPGQKAKEPSPAIRTEIGHVRDSQQDIQNAAEQIHDELSEQLPGDGKI